MPEEQNETQKQNSGNISLVDIIDIAAFQDLSIYFSQLTGLATAILDIDGKILTSSGWQRICTHFHRENSETIKKCLESDTILANQLAAGNNFNLYKCKNGLVDVAVPIMVENTHVGNIFIGQFLLETPDEQFFKKQAEKYNFEHNDYLEALRKVPILTSEKVKQATNFLRSLTAIIANSGVDKKKILDLNVNLEKRIEQRTQKIREERTFTESLINSLPGIVYLFNRVGRIIRWNNNLESVLGYSASQIADMSPLDLFSDPTERKNVQKAIQKVFKKGSATIETKVTTMSGKQIPYFLTGYKFTQNNVDYLVGVGLDISERIMIEKEKEVLIQQLQKTLSKVKQLSGFIPICASCKKIRDDKGYWNLIEAYIENHSEAEFSHSICPDCLNKLYSDYFPENDHE